LALGIQILQGIKKGKATKPIGKALSVVQSHFFKKNIEFAVRDFIRFLIDPVSIIFS